jgi:hypothetical protein
MPTGDRHRLTARGRAASLLLLALAQCSSFAPFEGPQLADRQHTLCYNRAAASPEQLHTLATQACGGAAPQLLDQAIDLSACPILVPVRVSFACAPSAGT